MITRDRLFYLVVFRSWLKRAFIKFRRGFVPRSLATSMCACTVVEKLMAMNGVETPV